MSQINQFSKCFSPACCSLNLARLFLLIPNTFFTIQKNPNGGLNKMSVSQTKNRIISKRDSNLFLHAASLLPVQEREMDLSTDHPNFLPDESILDGAIKALEAGRDPLCRCARCSFLAGLHRGIPAGIGFIPTIIRIRFRLQPACRNAAFFPSRISATSIHPSQYPLLSTPVFTRRLEFVP